MNIQNKYQERIYRYNDVCVFRKTKELYGGLSNMASGYPLSINNNLILSTEALYQACRFPHLPEIQSKIISERSPMTAKMVSKPFRSQTRTDWEFVRVEIMYWCLKVKLAQHFIKFGELLESTFNKPIVEESSKDAFWGALKSKDDNLCLSGVNALGRLLMKLRQEYYSDKFSLFFVKPLDIPNFLLFGESIQPVDERLNFLTFLSAKLQIGYFDKNAKALYQQIQNSEQQIHKASEVDNKYHKSNKKNNIQTNNSINTATQKILELLKDKPLTAKEILIQLDADYSIHELTTFLKSLNDIKVSKYKGVNRYSFKDGNDLVLSQSIIF